MVAVKQLGVESSERVDPIPRSRGRLRLIQGSFSSRKVSRQFPVIAGFHRAADGALLGVLVAVLMVSALSLHWRHLWTVAYSQLEDTRDLIQKLKYSTAMLEQHLLKRASQPLSMVRTNSDQLHYLENPGPISSPKNTYLDEGSLWKRFDSYPVNYGY